MVRIHSRGVINMSADLVRQTLLNHSELDRFFNARFSVVQPSLHANGVGAVRRVKIGPITFDEEITSVGSDHIEYRVIEPAPVKHHQGRISWKENSQGCEVDYKIQFESANWLPNIILRYVVQRDTDKAMRKLERYTREC